MSGADSLQLASSSDTDWLKARYQRLGESFLDDVQGRFGIVLRDFRSGTILIARDAMGNGYLAYALRPDGIAISTRDADLARFLHAEDDLDPLRWAEHFAWSEVSGARTFFRQVTPLLPGEMLIVDAGGARRRWLARPRFDLELGLSRWEDYVEEFRGRLRTAVAATIAGEGDVAVLLSGGLDSGPIAALAAETLRSRGRRLRALSWRVSDPSADERDLVREAADWIGLELEWIDCDDALPYSNLGRWPIHPSVPFQTPYRWFQERSYARAASLGCRTLIGGFGGDALYGHSRRWAWALLFAEGVGATVDRLRELAREIGWLRTVRSHLAGPLLPRARKAVRALPPWLTPFARELLRDRNRWPANVLEARRPRQAERLLSLLDASGPNLERFHLEPHGIRQESPLRDFGLVEFALNAPDHLLLQGGETRPVLRAATRGWIPDSVRTRRRKTEFKAAVEDGLSPARIPWARRVLESPDAHWRPYVDARAVAGWAEGSVTTHWDRLGLLCCLNAELWRLHRAGFDLASLEA